MVFFFKFIALYKVLGTLVDLSQQLCFLYLVFYCTVVDDSSAKTKSTPLAKVSNKLPKSKCSVPLEPLVFNGDAVTPSRAKRRASRSIPDDSTVTPKRSKGCGPGSKTAIEPVTSPRQRFGKGIDYLVLWNVPSLYPAT